MSNSSIPFAAGGSRRRLLAVALAASMIAAATADPPPSAAHPDTTVNTHALATPAAAPEAHTVTLVTGDVVTVRTLADGKTLTEVDQPD
ncbi:hypothetical protein, partial [Salinispora pacifica]|uniref:hypothetical protein n=1 Tax=Salinispora pacifica TaxID=351187 RepID=UPI0018DEED02